MWNKSNAINSCHGHSQPGVEIWHSTAVSYKVSPSSEREQSCTCPQEGIQTQYSYVGTTPPQYHSRGTRDQPDSAAQTAFKPLGLGFAPQAEIKGTLV